MHFLHWTYRISTQGIHKAWIMPSLLGSEAYDMEKIWLRHPPKNQAGPLCGNVRLWFDDVSPSNTHWDYRPLLPTWITADLLYDFLMTVWSHGAWVLPHYATIRGRPGNLARNGITEFPPMRHPRFWRWQADNLRFPINFTHRALLSLQGCDLDFTILAGGLHKVRHSVIHPSFPNLIKGNKNPVNGIRRMVKRQRGAAPVNAGAAKSPGRVLDLIPDEGCKSLQ